MPYYDNLYDTRIVCRCGKRLMDKNVTEIESILFWIGTEHSMIIWVCRNNNERNTACTIYAYMLRFINRFISIATIQATVYNGYHEVGYKMFHVVPEEVEDVNLPTIMNIL